MDQLFKYGQPVDEAYQRFSGYFSTKTTELESYPIEITEKEQVRAYC